VTANSKSIAELVSYFVVDRHCEVTEDVFRIAGMSQAKPRIGRNLEWVAQQNRFSRYLPTDRGFRGTRNGETSL